MGWEKKRMLVFRLSTGIKRDLIKRIKNINECGRTSVEGIRTNIVLYVS